VTLRQSNLRIPAAAKRTRDPRVKLTPRQLEIALLVADGLSGSEIADRLGVAIKTVEYHRRKIDQAIGLKGTALLVRYLIREGLLEP
jgi:DNA-binding CsgD family transcriptional regulator